MSYRQGKNILEHPDLQRLIEENAGQGVKCGGMIPGEPGYQEYVDFQEFIGFVLSVITSDRTPTSWGKILYLSDGVYVVPTLRPSEQEITDKMITALLGTQIALWGEITPNLRAVTVNIDGITGLLIEFFYDGSITEEIKKTAAEITMEASCFFPADFPYCDRLTRIDYPDEIPFSGRFVYFRKEPKSTPVPISIDPGVIPVRGKILLAALNALLGKTTPELRAVTVDWNDFVAWIHLYYDGEISETNILLARQAIEDFGEYLPSEFMHSGYIERLDYPQRIPYCNLVYQRKELSSELLYIGPPYIGPRVAPPSRIVMCWRFWSRRLLRGFRGQR